jgi:hypothetical protein
MILLISGLLRKYFYFPIYKKQTEELKQKNKKVNTKIVKEKKIVKEEDNNEKMKIYIDKEIK